MVIMVTVIFMIESQEADAYDIISENEGDIGPSIRRYALPVLHTPTLVNKESQCGISITNRHLKTK